MGKNWYPVIDYETCSECGACFNKCSHGVYEKKDNRPIIVNPYNCLDGCRGCQKLCPTQSIQYVGGVGESGECNCGCSCC